MQKGLWSSRTKRFAGEHEFPKGKEGIVFCRSCNAVYFKKSWHHNLRRHKTLREDIPVKFTVCPACVMIQNNMYEGKVILKNIPAAVVENLENLVHAFTHRAFQKDPMDRLIALKRTGKEMEATMTENQLAVKLAKKIKDVYKKVDMRVSYGHAKDKASEIVVTFR